jgi:hypothetical protein
MNVMRIRASVRTEEVVRISVVVISVTVPRVTRDPIVMTVCSVRISMVIINEGETHCNDGM